MKNIIMISILIITLITFFHCKEPPADVEGTWSGTLTETYTEAEDLGITIVIEQDGEDLEGVAQINDSIMYDHTGTIEGNDIELTLSLSGGADYQIMLEGTVDGHDITGRWEDNNSGQERMGGTFSITYDNYPDVK